MCGIVAIVGARQGAELGPLVDRMRDALAHRGPDDAGSVVLPEDGVALGMRRLSILDLEGGHQPMWDEQRRRCVVFNGEIYNFAELRSELGRRGHSFATDHSDTEVLVHGWEEWGEGLFERLNGMFAFALWDRDRRRLVLARDRAGEKPLYVAALPQGFAVASELKALLEHPGVDRELDLAAVEQYLAFDYVLAPRTMLAAVQKLRPGHYALIGEGDFVERPYWLPDVHERPIGEHEARRRLDGLLDRSVGLRMVADVPLGLFLSGGLDSTTVGWYMRRSSDAVESFSIGFEEAPYDETEYASLAARHLGTRHTIERLSSARALEIVPRVAEILDEPMGDQSILPTFLLSTFTRGSVKVALGGDGGDELFMGYDAYKGFRVSTLLRRLPAPVRSAVARSGARLAARTGRPRIPGLGWVGGVNDSVVHRVLTHLPRLEDGYAGESRRLLSAEARSALPAGTVFDGVESALLGDLDDRPLTADGEATVAFLRAYLADDVLVKVDRASMASSLEVRAPFLDPELLDFVLALPVSLKLRRLRPKHLLKALMRGRIPDAIVDRAKFGFNVPVSAWLRGPLAPTVREVLEPARIAAGGVLDPGAVRLLVDEHLEGRADRGRALWLLLQLELWRERWLK